MSILSTIKSTFFRVELSVDRVIEDIAHKVEHLSLIERTKRYVGELHERAANAEVDLSEAAHAEADRALAISKKLSALLSEGV